MDERKISKYISYILRHHPEDAGIILDEHGWADVSQLLEGVGRKYPLDMKLLEKIVRKDEKQRYSFDEAHERIRANQGHSIPVDVEPEQKQPPEVLYHGTGEKYTASIEREGLKHGSRLFVHLSKDRETAVNVGKRHGRPVVYTVDAGKMHEDGYIFYLSVNGVWLTEHVPPEYLKRI